MEKPGSPQLPTSSFQSELDKIDYSRLQTTIQADVTNNNGHSAGGKMIVKKRLASSSAGGIFHGFWCNFLKWLKFMLISQSENNMKRNFNPLNFH